MSLDMLKAVHLCPFGKSLLLFLISRTALYRD